MEVPRIDIHADWPNLGRIFELVDQGVLLYDDGTFNIPSQLHGISDEYLWVLLEGRLIRIFIIEWEDPETHQINQYTNKEDIEILRKFATDPNEIFAEKCRRMSNLVTKCIITRDSINKDAVKTFWKDYYNHNLGNGNN